MRGSLALPLLSATLLAGALIGSGVALSEDSQPSVTPAPATAPDATALEARRAAGLSFGADSYAWKLVTGKDGEVSAEIVNDRVSPATVKAVLTLRGPVTPASPGPAVDSALTVAVDPETIEPGARAIVSVRLSKDATLATGTYSGRLAAYATGGAAVVHVPVTITVAAAGTAGTVAPKPAAPKLRIQAIRWFPFVDRTVEVRRAVVPLSAVVPQSTPATDIALTKDAVLGGLPGDRGGVASVRYAGAVTKLRHGLLGLKLDAANFDGPGTYAGTIHLLGEEEKSGDVEVTIVTKDTIVWAIIALAIGIMGAMWARRWRGVDHPATLLERRLESAKTGYAEAVKSFKRSAAGQRWGPYDTATDFAEQAESVAEAITALRGATGFRGFVKSVLGITASPFDKIPPERRKLIIVQLVKLEAHAVDVRALDEVAQALQAGLREVRGLAPISALLRDDAGGEPAWVANADSKLAGSEVTVSALAKVVAEMRVATDVAKWWTKAHDVVARDAEWIAEARAAGVDTRTARSVLYAAWTSLWLAGDAEAAAEKQRRANLERGHWQVLVLLSELEDDVRQTETSLAAEANLLTLGATYRMPQLVGAAAVAELADRSKTRAEELDRRLRTGDTVATLLAWIVALFTGLTALYFTKTFGSPTDYLTAVLWGLTTAAAIDALVGALPQPPEPDVPEKAAA